MFRKDGIRCNAIAPGATATKLGTSVDLSRMDQTGYARAIPVMNTVDVSPETNEGLMSPECAAQALMFLASDLSKGITGVVVPVDEGWSVI